MNQDEKHGIIAGLCLAAAVLPTEESFLRELAFALHKQWGFGAADHAYHERLCADLALDTPRRGGDA